jgi:hypothetical protein
LTIWINLPETADVQIEIVQWSTATITFEALMTA